MNTFYRAALWDANGLAQRRYKLPAFLDNNEIDILLISEKHFSTKNHFNIRGFNFYGTKHSDGTAHEGTAIIIRKNIKHHELIKHDEEQLQATSIQIEEWNGPLVLSAVYCPPRHQIKTNDFIEYFETLGPRFIAGGDYNAKNIQWESRLNTPRGRELSRAIAIRNMDLITARQPTYWPTDRNKIPDLLDFFITKGVAKTNVVAESSLELWSDHTPVIITISTGVIYKTVTPNLYNKKKPTGTASGKQLTKT